MSSRLTSSQQGELYIFGQAILWSLFPIISIITLRHLSPVAALGIGTLIAAMFFALVLTVRQRWAELFIKSAMKDILISTCILGVVFYGLVFWGFQYTTAGNASILLLAEIFFTMLILGGLKKEHISWWQVVGGMCLAIGAFIVLFEGSFSFNKGGLLILLATAIAPFGNGFMKSARKQVSAETIFFVRSVISGIFFILLAYLFDTIPNYSAIRNAFPALVVNGLLLLGFSKILWVEGIHRISVSKAISLNAVNPLFTLLFVFLILGDVPTAWQILGVIPAVIGILLITDFSFKRQARDELANL